MSVLRAADVGVAGELSRFFEICVHTLLHERSLYPAALFAPARAYGLAAVACRHPLLNAYVSQLASNVQAWLAAGQVQRIVLAVMQPPRTDANPTHTARVLERFVFEFLIPSPASAGSSSAAGASTAAAASAPLPATALAELHAEFAAVLLRLSACDGHFSGKRPADCTWTVLLYTNQPTPADQSAAGSSPLVRSIDSPSLRWQQVTLPASSASSGAVPPFLDFPPERSRIMPLRSVRTSMLHMEVYAEAAMTEETVQSRKG